MASWRAGYVDQDNSAGIASVPSTDKKNIGAAFQIQTADGSGQSDDRINYEAGITELATNENVPGLQAYYATGGLGIDIVQSPIPVSWYATLRDDVSVPLATDEWSQIANRDADIVDPVVNETIDGSGYLFTVGDRLVPEKPVQNADRVSTMPADIQRARPWDIVMGAFPWLGTKVALQRPLATAPMTFDTALDNPLPSGTGTANADIPNTPSFAPYPLTFRVTPEPWDTAGDGYYVDSGR